MKKWLLFLFVFFLLPITVFAYSSHIIVGGETIGIEVHSSGVYVVGFYEIHGKKMAEDAGFLVGDIIVRVDEQDISSIEDLNMVLKAREMKFYVLRNQKEIMIPFSLKMDDDIIKTGLYVKDQIRGIGTLSYIDPESKVYGSLGHEILESSSFSRFQIQGGNIFKAEVSSIKKSDEDRTGEKNAVIHYDSISGSIDRNEVVGIFGKYTGTFYHRDLLEVGTSSDIHQGKAVLRTVIDHNKIEDFDIQILSIDETSDTKNILFEITDKRLLEKTGGIVQGMSGSPIIQNQKVIGVVNYVIVEDAKRGYGIFITRMLEEGDKILS